MTEAMTTQRMISNSEVSTWLQCTRKYFYEYFLNIERKAQSGPITKGILIHALLEEYYAAKQLGLSEGDCRAAALQVIMDEATNDGSDMVELGQTRDLVFGYFDKYMLEDEKYEILAVESKFKLDIKPEYAMVGTIDLALRDRETGTIIGVDHKSSYNFWTPDQTQMAGQFIKYLILMREAGYDADVFMVNQVRTRPVKNGDLYQRAFIKPSKHRIEQVLRQHIMASEQIMEFRANGSNKEHTLPIYDKYICTNCPFYNLCDSDTEGVDIRYQIEADFQPRTGYGYNEELLG